MPRPRVVVVVVVAVAVGACSTSLRPPDRPERRTKTQLHATAFEAGNGLRVISVPEPGAPQVSITVRYDVGAKDDPPGQEGIAHLVEHLMFDQTYEGRDLMARLDDAATYYNAFTEVDATTYVSRARPERLADVLAVEGVRLALRCDTITEDVFVREREVVLNEIRQSAADSRTLDTVNEVLFPAGHPYRKVPGGTERSVAAITREQACAFVDAHYAPGNAVVVVSGGVTDAEVDDALGKLFGRVPKRAFVAANAVPSLAPRFVQIEKSAPIDDDRVLVAWPLPTAPGQRAKVKAVAHMVWGRVNAAVKGSVATAELGGAGARFLVIMIDPAIGESVEDAITGARRGVEGTPQWMEPDTFERSRQIAVHDTFAGLEDRATRDARLAAEMLAGHGPSDAIGEELAAVNKMTRDEAREIARRELAWDQATIVALRAKDDPVGVSSVVGKPIHDAERQRPADDGAGANQPATFDASTSPLARAQTRVLSGGMRIILLPMSSVPTVDIRLIFPVGSADDPAGQEGAAILAAEGLHIAGSDLEALTAFYATGGQLGIDVTDDTTTFTATGVDMGIDHLLTGLERLVRNGRYDGESIDATVAAARKEVAADADDADTATARDWREAVFGVQHPYVDSGTKIGKLGADALGDFRARHYQPARATLIVAGGFDPDLASRWIDYLFADWSGKGPDRPEPLADLEPRRIAMADEGKSQLGIAVALPAHPTFALRAPQLIAAAMLDLAANDVRRQLAASYGVSAALIESRLAVWYQLGGSVDAARAPEAFTLLKARVEELRAGGEPVAPLFVAARRRVLERLTSIDTGATELAAHAARTVRLGRDLDDEIALVDQVRTTTLDAMTAALAGLDLTHGVILLRGPRAQLDAGFTALGVKPRAAP